MTVTNNILTEITQRLVGAFHPDKIILFGSHAWGTAREDSDVDVLVIVPASDEPAYRRAQRAYRVLQGLHTPIDVMVRTREEVSRELGLRPSLLNKIVTEGRVLHE